MKVFFYFESFLEINEVKLEEKTIICKQKIEIIKK